MLGLSFGKYEVNWALGWKLESIKRLGLKGKRSGSVFSLTPTTFNNTVQLGLVLLHITNPIQHRCPARLGTTAHHITAWCLASIERRTQEQ